MISSNGLEEFDIVEVAQVIEGKYTLDEILST